MNNFKLHMLREPTQSVDQSQSVSGISRLKKHFFKALFADGNINEWFFFSGDRSLFRFCRLMKPHTIYVFIYIYTNHTSTSTLISSTIWICIPYKFQMLSSSTLSNYIYIEILLRWMRSMLFLRKQFSFYTWPATPNNRMPQSSSSSSLPSPSTPPQQQQYHRQQYHQFKF